MLSPNRNFPNLRLGAWTLLALAALMAWDASSGDLLLARMVGTPYGFPWRNDAFLLQVMHEGAKNLSWLLVFGLLLAIRWPVGVLRRIAPRARVQLAVTIIASVLAITLFKHASTTSCPWDLQEFGGVAHYVSHWAWGVRDGGPGGCFPAGHASSAFAWLGGYFVLRRVAPRAAWIWLGVAMAAGFALGWTQQMRGAHFMSHTLWTAWICWVVGLAIDTVAVHFFDRQQSDPAVVLHAGH